MKKYGLIGGTSWHSTVDYYATINRLINEHHGDNTNPQLRIVSLNQKQIHDFQRSDDWAGVADIFQKAALELQGLGVEGIAMCANTPSSISSCPRSAQASPMWRPRRRTEDQSKRRDPAFHFLTEIQKRRSSKPIPGGPTAVSRSRGSKTGK